jgi:uncharacterized protein (TIGR00251 family)
MLLAVRVTPRSGKNVLQWEEKDERGGAVLKARLTAPPVDGAANEALIALLAEQLHISKGAIRIVHGTSSRQKMVEITGLTVNELRARLL